MRAPATGWSGSRPRGSTPSSTCPTWTDDRRASTCLPVALSADGRFVAYPSSDPAGDGSDWVTGVSVYDSVTGDVERRDLRGELGRTADALGVGGTPAVRRLLRGHRPHGRQRLGASRSTRSSWDVDTGSTARRGRRAGRPGGECRPRPRARGVVAVRQERVVTVDQAGRRRPLLTLDRDRGDRVVVSPDGSRAAVGKADVSSGQSGIWVTDVDGPAAGQTRAVPGIADDRRAGGVARRVARGRARLRRAGLRRRSTSRPARGRRCWSPWTTSPGRRARSVAADAWHGPAFDAPEPDRPLDPVLLL